jgi:hypothetical protein
VGALQNSMLGALQQTVVECTASLDTLKINSVSLVIDGLGECACRGSGGWYNWLRCLSTNLLATCRGMSARAMGKAHAEEGGVIKRDEGWLADTEPESRDHHNYNQWATPFSMEHIFEPRGLHGARNMHGSRTPDKVCYRLHCNGKMCRSGMSSAKSQSLDAEAIDGLVMSQGCGLHHVKSMRTLNAGGRGWARPC